MRPDLSVAIKTLQLANPTILASGLMGLDCGELKRIAGGGAGAVTMKSLTAEMRKGHNNPILVEVEGGFMNAVGYANKGIEKGCKEFAKWDKSIPLIGSVAGQDADDFARLAEKLMVSVPVEAMEIVLSCPHTPGYGLLAGQGSPEATAAITKAVRKVVTVPLIIKLSPNVPAMGDVAKAAESEGADAINMGNTAGPGMKIDINRAQPILDFKVGGMSGPIIKPLMIRCVWDISLAVKLPIIATGGITTGEDAIEAIMAGATAVGIGTAIYYRGFDVYRKVTHEMTEWMEKNGVTSLTEIRGKAHN